MCHLVVPPLLVQFRFESDNKESKKRIFLESLLFLYDYSRNEPACQVATPSVSVHRHGLSPQFTQYLVENTVFSACSRKRKDASALGMVLTISKSLWVVVPRSEAAR